MRLVVAGIIVMLGVSFGCKRGGTPEEQGERFYDKACSRCHGDEAKGGFVPEGAKSPSRDLTAADWQGTVTDEEIRQLIRDGRGDMPGFGQVFSLDQIDTIVKYLRALKK